MRILHGLAAFPLLVHTKYVRNSRTRRLGVGPGSWLCGTVTTYNLQLTTCNTKLFQDLFVDLHTVDNRKCA
jgi:hypothetical protein